MLQVLCSVLYRSHDDKPHSSRSEVFPHDAGFFYSDGLEKRFGSLSASVSERAEHLQTAVAQSVSVQEGLKVLLSWLDKLHLNPGAVEPNSQAVQDAFTQNQVGPDAK